MNIIILAAGRGSRLAKLTEEIPKVLNSFNGKTLLDWHLLNIWKSGFTSKINLVGGYMANKLSSFPINLIVNQSWDKFNIGSSLLAADYIISSGKTLIIYGDIFYEPGLISQLMNFPRPAVVSVENWHKIWLDRMDNPLIDLQSFKYNDREELVEIGLPVTSFAEIQGQFAGAFSLDKRTWEVMKTIPRIEQLDSTSLINSMVDLGYSFSVLKYHGIWREFDLPLDFENPLSL